MEKYLFYNKDFEPKVKITEMQRYFKNNTGTQVDKFSRKYLSIFCQLENIPVV